MSREKRNQLRQEILNEEFPSLYLVTIEEKISELKIHETVESMLEIDATTGRLILSKNAISAPSTEVEKYICAFVSSINRFIPASVLEYPNGFKKRWADSYVTNTPIVLPWIPTERVFSKDPESLPKYISCRESTLIKGIDSNALSILYLCLPKTRNETVAPLINIAIFFWLRKELLLAEQNPKLRKSFQIAKNSLFWGVPMARLYEIPYFINKLQDIPFKIISKNEYYSFKRKYAQICSAEKDDVDLKFLTSFLKNELREIPYVKKQISIIARKKSLLSWACKYTDRRDLSDTIAVFVGVSIEGSNKIAVKPKSARERVIIEQVILEVMFALSEKLNQKSSEEKVKSTFFDTTTQAKGGYLIIQTDIPFPIHSNQNIILKSELRITAQTLFNQGRSEHPWYQFAFKYPRSKSESHIRDNLIYKIGKISVNQITKLATGSEINDYRKLRKTRLDIIKNHIGVLDEFGRLLILEKYHAHKNIEEISNRFILINFQNLRQSGC